MTDHEQPAETTIEHIAHDPDGCGAWIPGVPKNIPRARMMGLVESLGLNPRETKTLQFEPHAIYAEVYALRDGKRYWDGGPIEEAATHRIAIPIADSPGDGA